MRNIIFPRSPIMLIIVLNYHYGAEAFLSLPSTARKHAHADRKATVFAAKGFGASTGGASKKKKRASKNNRLRKPAKHKAQPYVKSEQGDAIEALAALSSKTCIGRAVADVQSLLGEKTDIDPFWDLMPSLIQSRFPSIQDDQLERVAGMVKFALHPDNQSLLDQSIIDDPWRPHLLGMKIFAIQLWRMLG